MVYYLIERPRILVTESELLDDLASKLELVKTNTQDKNLPRGSQEDV